MSNFDSSLSGEESDDGTSEVKRLRHEPRNYGLNRRYERQSHQKATRKVRLASKEYCSQKSNLEGLIFDNGGYTIKVNYSFEESPKIIPNCIMKAKSERKRLFIGSQIDECRDCSGLFYLIPSERGYITKWDVQKPIWDFVFSKNVCPINNCPLIMTQPLFNFKSIQDCIDEIFFEEYEVSSMLRTNPSDLAMTNYYQEIGAKPPCIIVDSGYSFTHVVPYLEGKKYFQAIKRINVGGKLLTNHLKDIISYRQYHVMEETYVINQVKEDTCFVSQDFKNDLRIAELPSSKNNIIKNYVLPDFNNIRRGYIQDSIKKDELAENCQILRLNNERFTVPEILFHPSDIGMKNIGIAEAIYKCLLSCPRYYQKNLAKNIVCIGGSTKFPGFRDRLQSELRSMIPASWEVNVYQPDDPISYSWMGGKVILKDPELKNKLVTKQQYEELGLSAIQNRFNDFSTDLKIHEDSKPKQQVELISYIEHVKKYDVFGKGPLEDVNNEEKSITTDNSQAAAGISTKVEEEIDVSGKTETDEKVALASENLKNVVNVEDKNKLNEANKSGKVTKKFTRNNSGPIIYSVKIVSSATKTS